MEVEKRSSKGGFLQLFDWNVKSRKKLFSNKSDLPESSKQGKENLDNLTISRLQQMKLHENMHGPSLIGSDSASSVSNEEGCGTKAPGVVARLMGLDSLPTLDTSDPGFTSFVDSHSFRHSHHSPIATDFESEHRFGDYGMRNKLDGFSRNPVEDRLQKLQNRPIERFQTEILPPRSAKSVPITHHRMLSPIKSPGFILSRKAASIMEAASKMIEPSPQSTVNGRLPSVGSSSVPLRIRDLKEKMEAAQRTSRLSEALQRRPKEHSSVSSSKSQPRDSLSEVVILKQGVAGSSKHKNKSVSLATIAKTNSQKGDGSTSRNSRSSMTQKEDDVKSAQLDKKQRNTQRRVQNRSTTGRTPEVLTQNNQKQNCASNNDRTSLKARVPYQQDRKSTSTSASFREVKTSKKAVENSAVGARKVELVTSETGKELSLSKTKISSSGKKRLTNRDIISDGSAANDVLIKEKERSVKCNITVDGSSNWDSVDKKNGMDVVSFTFTSPIKKSEPSAQSVVKSRGLCLKFQDDSRTSDLPCLGTSVIDSDALGVLLEQKLKELSSRVEASHVTGGPPSNSNAENCASAKMFTFKDKSIMQDDSDILVGETLVTAKSKWQEVDSNSNSENTECGVKYQYLEPSLSDDNSCITSNSTTTLTSNGYSFTKNIQLSAVEMEVEDSATSESITARCSSHWELEYIRELLRYANFDLGPTQTLINASLYDHLENQNKNTNRLSSLQTKVLFDCVTVCLESRRECAFGGSYKEWAKLSKMFERMADEIQKDIRRWTSLQELMVDEVVDKDMSSGEGKWLDFEAEAVEEGMVIESGILRWLIDEMVTDFLSA